MHPSIFALLLCAAPPSVQPDTIRADSAVVADTTFGPAAGDRGLPRSLALIPRNADAPEHRDVAPLAQSVEYSDWYERRLTIHKWASYTTLPLFAFQYVAGRELYDESTAAPAWARNGHGVAATGIAALFGVNTVTGVWNLWDARKDPEGRTRRTVHAVLMLVSDAGFAATGVLAEKAERSPSNRQLHRNIAISSMAVATVSYLIMLPPFRRD